MASPPLSPLLTTRLWPVQPLLVLGVVRLPNHLAPLASLISRSPLPSPSMSTITSFAGETAFSLTPLLPKSANGLRARPFVMIGSRTFILGTSFKQGRWFGATGLGTWSQLTLGTRTHIPTRHMLDTLGVQTTSDSNVPSGQKLGLLKMYP